MGFELIHRVELLEKIKDAFKYNELKNLLLAIKELNWNPFSKPDNHGNSGFEKWSYGICIIYKFLATIAQLLDNGVKEVAVFVPGVDKLDVAVEFASKYIKVPWYVRWLKKSVLKTIFSLIIKVFNDNIGKDWADKLVVGGKNK